AILRNGAGIWRSAPGRVPAVAPRRPVESIHELDLKELVDADQTGTRGTDQDPAQCVGARVGEAQGLEVLGAGEVSKGDDSVPADASRQLDLAAANVCPQPLPGFWRDRADMTSFQC